MYQKKFKCYVFLEEINNIIKKNLLKFKNISVIIDKQLSINQKINLEIIQFCKNNKIPFYVKDSYNFCIKYGSSGIFISSQNKNIIKPMLLKKNFKIIGTTHNQLEYYKKTQQGCSLLFLSPLFYNKKYSINKILGIVKFNLITIKWVKETSGLGGVNFSNINKIKMLKVHSFGFKRLINNL